MKTLVQTFTEDTVKELVAVRRDLHQHPETAFEEVRTSGIVAERLKALGLDVRTGVAKTGVLATVRGARPGMTVLLRADMDALPIQERTTPPTARRSRARCTPAATTATPRSCSGWRSSW
jgi:amidohydrolase